MLLEEDVIFISALYISWTWSNHSIHNLFICWFVLVFCYNRFYLLVYYFFPGFLQYCTIVCSTMFFYNTSNLCERSTYSNGCSFSTLIHIYSFTQLRKDALSCLLCSAPEATDCLIVWAVNVVHVNHRSYTHS